MVSLSQINTEAVQGLVAYLNNRKLSAKTVENVVVTLSSILRTAKDWKYACGDFDFSKLKLPQQEVESEPRTFTDAEATQLIAAAKEPLKAILAVAAMLGLRAGEVLGLRVEDLDFTNKIIKVRQSVDSHTRKTKITKSPTSKANLPMPPQLEVMLKNHLMTHDGLNELAFYNRNGRAFSVNKLRNRLHVLCDQLKIPRGGFHAFRHGTATSLVAANVNPAIVQKQLRHADIRTTMGLYVHTIPSQHREAVEIRSSHLVN